MRSEGRSVYALGLNSAWWAEAIDGAIWSFAPGDGLRRFDLDTHEMEVFGYAAVGYTQECCIALDDAIWMVSNEGRVWRFDLATHEVTDKLDVAPGGLREGVAGAGAIWIPQLQGVVYRIDTILREVTHRYSTPTHIYFPITSDAGHWT